MALSLCVTCVRSFAVSEKKVNGRVPFVRAAGRVGQNGLTSPCLQLRGEIARLHKRPAARVRGRSQKERASTRPVDVFVLIFLDFGMSILGPILVPERLKYSLLILRNVVCDEDNFGLFDQSAIYEFHQKKYK